MLETHDYTSALDFSLRDFLSEETSIKVRTYLSLSPFSKVHEFRNIFIISTLLNFFTNK